MGSTSRKECHHPGWRASLHARHLVREWGLNGLADTSELLVSELVTNAVQAIAGRETHAPVRLRLSGDTTRVLIEVWDADPGPPAPRDGLPDPEDEGGRGLFLVAALSSRWSWYNTQDPSGKVTWCELNAGLPEAAAGHPPALLPRRTPQAQQVRPAEPMTDPDILRRVRDQLRANQPPSHPASAARAPDLPGQKLSPSVSS